MNEYIIGIFSTLKVLTIAIFAFCYWMGGRGAGKWIRRFLGSLLFSGILCVFAYFQGSFSMWYLLYPVTLSIALSMGYGGDKLWEKIRRRFIYGLCMGLSCLPIVIPNGAWGLWSIQLPLCIFSSVFMGTINPFFSAVDEENVIAVCSVMFVPFMLRIGG